MNNGCKLKISIAIATAGRAELLSDTLEYLASLVHPSDELLICPAARSDIDYEKLNKTNVIYKIVSSSRGLTAQRNALLQACNSDLIIFFDDDFLPDADYLSNARKLFNEDDSLVLATGKLFADGILTKGISFNDALNIIATAKAVDSTDTTETYSAYGCNMVVRLSPVRSNKIQFDENLPLYGWLEDLDFSRTISRLGKVVISPCLRGVHLGIKNAGRSPGRQLGYSQIANPLYLVNKGTMHKRRAYILMCKNLISNIIKTFFPEPWIDRKSRLLGNICGLRDLILGKLHPKNILNM